MTATQTIFRFSVKADQKYFVKIVALFDNTESYPILEVEGEPNFILTPDIEIVEISPYNVTFEMKNPEVQWFLGFENI